ncbi:MAG TPA: GFA family protein, partial [Rhizobacter sp.]|nr:GFA family protein [Rhizobacter sp.]
PNCGSSLYTHAAQEHPTSYGLRVGCIEQRHALVPRRQVWCRSALEWTQDLGAMEKREREWTEPDASEKRAPT